MTGTLPETAFQLRETCLYVAAGLAASPVTRAGRVIPLASDEIDGAGFVAGETAPVMFVLIS